MELLQQGRQKGQLLDRIAANGAAIVGVDEQLWPGDASTKDFSTFAAKSSLQPRPEVLESCELALALLIVRAAHARRAGLDIRHACT